MRSKLCAACGGQFAAKIAIAGKTRQLYRRRFCLSCSPFAVHNTSPHPPGDLTAEELARLRRQRRSATTYRSQKKRRRETKAALIAAHGGRCQDCGYARSVEALQIHPRDASAKDFAIGSASASAARLWAEAAKCDLICANCHRSRHARRVDRPDPVVAFRRRTKARAIAFCGGRCGGCGAAPIAAALEFHHVDPGGKDFAISSDGVPRPWSAIVAELAKCVMLCANCHREVHAGVRELFDDGLLGLAEEAGAYAA
mgnify:CR=1 FL=1